LSPDLLLIVRLQIVEGEIATYVVIEECALPTVVARAPSLRHITTTGAALPHLLRSSSWISHVKLSVSLV